MGLARKLAVAAVLTLVSTATLVVPAAATPRGVWDGHHQEHVA